MAQHVLSELNDRLGISDGSMQDFFTFDMSPLQKAFMALAAKVEQCQKENVSLRAELAELKIAKRIEALEQGLQELADSSRAAPAYLGMDPAAMEAGMGAVGLEGLASPSRSGDGRSLSPSVNSPMVAGLGPGSPGFTRFAPGGLPGLRPGGMGSPVGGMSPIGGMTMGHMHAANSVGGGADGSWVMYEFGQLKERVGTMERKAEALWHVQEDDEQLRGAVERLRADVVAVQGGVQEAQGAAAAATALAEKQNYASAEAVQYIKDLQDKVHILELQGLKGSDERREMGHKYETTVSQIWDQLRHVEGSLAQRLTMAETSHVATLQEVDEAKEATSEVLQRVDDIKRHTSALENKLESFNTQVAAAISPLHNALAAANEKLEMLSACKQDTGSAIKMGDVEVAVARAIDYADRRGDNLLKAIAGVETRLEELAHSTPNKGEVVLTADLEALLTEHAHELDGHLDRLKTDLLAAVAHKVDRDELAAMDLRLGGRLGGLEGAILKGLKAISDKVSSALAEKLDMLRFNEFKLQVRAILADVEDRLRDWSPAALGTKAPVSGDASGAPSCLCCDTRVRAVRDLRAMGFKDDDRVFSPEKLPMTEALFPNISTSRNPVVGAHNNARLAHRQAAAEARLRGTTTSIMEPLQSSAHTSSSGAMAVLLGHTQAVAGPGSAAGALAVSASTASLTLVDPASYANLPPSQSPTQKMTSNAGTVKNAAAWGVKVEVETVSGMIGKGHLPNGNRTSARSGANANASASANAAASGPIMIGAAPGSPVGGQRPMRTPVAAAAAASGLSTTAGHGPSGLHLSSRAEGAAGRESPKPEASQKQVSPWAAELPSPTHDKGPVAVLHAAA